MSIKLLAEELYDGETRRQDCPLCGRKGTFTITREGPRVVWNCFSAHCDYRGAMGSRSDLVHTRPRNQKVTKFTGDLSELTNEQEAFLQGRVGFTGVHRTISGVKYAPVEDRYAYPILAPTGRRRGWVLRAYDGIELRAKTLTRLDVEEPHLSWYRGTEHSSKLLIVEDIPSAVRATLHFPGWCVAMCGGGIGPDYVRELTSHGRSIVWAFDADATAAAIRHHRIYGLCFESSTVLPLSKDLKDQSEGELKETLQCVSQKS